MTTIAKDCLSTAAEHLRAASESIALAIVADPDGMARFAARLDEAGAGEIEGLAQECELVSALMDRNFRARLVAAE